MRGEAVKSHCRSVTAESMGRCGVSSEPLQRGATAISYFKFRELSLRGAHQ